MQRLSLTFAAILLSATGCAVGQTISYHETTVALVASAPLRVGVVVNDQRSEVVDGTKQPNFVGILRGGFGNPFDVTTTSGQPLAVDVTGVLERALTERHYGVVKAPGNTDRVLVVTMKTWRSDTMISTGLKFDLAARVLSMPGGSVLGESQVHGNDDLGSDQWRPSRVAKEGGPTLLKAQLEALLNAKAIVQALSAVPPPGAAPPPPPVQNAPPAPTPTAVPSS